MKIRIIAKKHFYKPEIFLYPLSDFPVKKIAAVLFADNGTNKDVNFVTLT